MRSWLLIAMLIAIAGCQRGSRRELGTAEGQVTIGGAPVSQGSVIFEDASQGIAVTASLDAEGRFRIRTHAEDGIPPGTYRVAVTPASISRGEVPLAGTTPPERRKNAAEIGKVYQTIASTPLRAKVAAGKNPRFEFRLK